MSAATSDLTLGAVSVTWCSECRDDDVDAMGAVGRRPARGQVPAQQRCGVCGAALELVEPTRSHDGGWAHPWSVVRAGGDDHWPVLVKAPAHSCRQCTAHRLVAAHVVGAARR